MSLKYLVEDYLREEPKFRERKNKDRGIVNLLVNRYGLHPVIQSGLMTKEKITTIVEDYASMDRAWRKCLEENSALRGSDYDDKDELERKKMSELGYAVPIDYEKVEAVKIYPQQTLI